MNFPGRSLQAEIKYGIKVGFSLFVLINNSSIFYQGENETKRGVIHIVERDIQKTLCSVNQYIPPCFPHCTPENTYALVDHGQMPPLAECIEQ